MKVKPREKGLIVHYPNQARILKDTGEEVPDISYWRRRLKAGEVVKVSGPSQEVVSPEPIKDPVTPPVVEEVKTEKTGEKKSSQKSSSSKKK